MSPPFTGEITMTTKTKTLPPPVLQRVGTLSSDLTELLAAIEPDQRYTVLALVLTKSAEMVFACDRDASKLCENWLG